MSEQALGLLPWPGSRAALRLPVQLACFPVPQGLCAALSPAGRKLLCSPSL